MQSGLRGIVAPFGVANQRYKPAVLGMRSRPSDRKLSEAFSVRDFGARGDGKTDDRAAIITADLMAAAFGRKLYFPAGIYNVSNSITPSTTAHWIGENKFTTVLRTTSATLDLIEGSNSFVTIEGIQLGSSVTRSGGWYVDIAGTNWTVYDCYLANAFEAIRIQNTVSILLLERLTIQDTVTTTGVSIRINGGLAMSFKSIVCTGSTSPFAHLVVKNCGDLVVDADCHFIGAITNMYINPVGGDVIVSIKFRGWLDQGDTYNLHFDMGGGTVQRCSWIGAWMVQGGSANVFISGATGTVDGIDFTDCEAYDSPFGYSFDASAGVTVKNIQIVGGRVAESSDTGIYTDDISDLQVVGVRLGDVGGFGVNAIGIELNGSTDHVMVSGCDFRGSTTPFTNNASGTDIQVNSSIGYDHWVSYTPTVASGTGTFTSVAATGRYKRIGNTVHFYVSVVITTNGTAATDIRPSLPFTAANVLSGIAGGGGGRDNTTGPGCTVYVPANAAFCSITRYDNVYPGANGRTILAYGTYECA